jgi:hypothetical protein
MPFTASVMSNIILLPYLFSSHASLARGQGSVIYGLWLRSGYNILPVSVILAKICDLKEGRGSFKLS